MKDYKRLTKWSKLGTLHVFGFNGEEISLSDVSALDVDNLAGRLAELEDKIESGEIGNVSEYKHKAEVAERAGKIIQRDMARVFDVSNPNIRELIANIWDLAKKQAEKEIAEEKKE